MSEMTPLKAIRAYCLGCMCDQPGEVKLCPITKCELYPFRFGKNPYQKHKELTEEQRAEIGRRLKESRAQSINN